MAWKSRWLITSSLTDDATDVKLVLKHIANRGESERGRKREENPDNVAFESDTYALRRMDELG
jgi:hypothetical protein